MTVADRFRSRIVGQGEAAPEELLANPENWRIHPRYQRDALRDVLRQVGWVQQVVVNRTTGRLIDGHLRVDLAMEDDEPMVPFVEVELSEDEERLVLASLDPLAAMAVTDREKVEQVLADVSAEGDALSAMLSDLPAMPVFEPEGLATNGDSGAEALEDPPVPELPKTPRTKPGDVWVAGDHLLACGDSTKRKDVAKLVAPGDVDLLFTSPPYNVDVPYEDHDDAHLKWDDYSKLLRGVLEAWLTRLGPGRFVGWNIAVSPRVFPARQWLLLEDVGLTMRREVVWDKCGQGMPAWWRTEQDPLARNFHPTWSHEVVLLASNGEVEYGDPIEPRAQPLHSVVGIPPATATRDVPAGDYSQGGSGPGLKRSYAKAHPAVFPLALPELFVRHLAAEGELVADPFLGAGTTTIAAERLGRRSVGLDISPAFVDVAIERLELATGLKARRRRKR